MTAGASLLYRYDDGATGVGAALVVIRTRGLASVVVAVLLAHPAVVRAAEIKVWTARAIATVLAEIGPRFERTTGHTLTISSGLPTDFLRRAAAGEPPGIPRRHGGHLSAVGGCAQGHGIVPAQPSPDGPGAPP